MSLGPQDTTGLLDHVHIWLPFCMIELQLASADGMADCVYRQWFLEVFLGPFSNVNDRIMPNEWCNIVWEPEDQGHPTKVFDIVPYAQRFLQFFWIFWWCYACSWWKFAKPLQFDVEECCFWNIVCLCLSKTSLLCYRLDVNLKSC